MQYRKPVQKLIAKWAAIAATGDAHGIFVYASISKTYKPGGLFIEEFRAGDALVTPGGGGGGS